MDANLKKLREMELDEITLHDFFMAAAIMGISSRESNNSASDVASDSRKIADAVMKLRQPQ